ncbi:oligosaccharide flippase family protein [Calditerrivibrio sp.]|uniref:oligosaccharide flippase family protein n=1 Tax=Calditerrivibrio sp. TaxID=2792612 RepID=UPI003D0DBC71
MFSLKSSFLKNVLTLFTGSILSQVITLAISPILTRQYSPNDFGEYAFYLSIITILSVVATGRYELAIMIADGNEKADATTYLCLIISLLAGGFVLITAIILKSFGFFIKYNHLLFYAAFHIMLIGFYNTFYHRLNRYGRFNMISMVVIVQSSVVAIYQIAFGFINPGSIHLIVGNILGIFTSVLTILFLDKGIGNIFKYRGMILEMSRRYINFPKFDLWAGLFNIGFQQLPVILITTLFGTTNGGYFSLTQRVLQAPVSLIGGSILGAFRQKAVEDFRNYGQCSRLFLKVMYFMFFVAILPTLLVLFYGKSIFEYLFGSQWGTAGLFSQIMILAFLARFVASPLTYLFYIAERQDWNLIGQVLFIIVTFLGFFIGYKFDSVVLGLVIYTAGNCVLYTLYLYISYLFSKGLYVYKR